MILNLNLPCNEPPYSSVDGLLVLCTRGMMSHGIFSYEYIMWPRDLFICNPFNRHYIKLPCPQEFSASEPQVQMDTFGFGVSRVSGQYKLVRVFHVWPEVPSIHCWNWIVELDCLCWPLQVPRQCQRGICEWEYSLDGSSVWISCFDLETQLFTTISPPPCHNDREDCLSVSTLRDCICVCDNSGVDEIVIWLMKEYGDDKSWTKEFVIHKENQDYDQLLVCPIKAFQNGDILMAFEMYHRLLYFSNGTKTIREVDLSGLESGYCINAVAYTPSFIPLKTFAMEKVSSF